MHRFRTHLLTAADVVVSPTIGTLVALSPEEVVITPRKLEGEPAEVDVRIHFPRLGFVVRPWKEKEPEPKVKAGEESRGEPVQVEVGESVEVAKPKL